MQLNFINKGTVFYISSGENGGNSDNLIETRFFEFKERNLFYAEGIELYNNFNNLANINLNVIFYREANMYSFTGKLVDITRRGNVYLTIIEQATDFQVSSRRKYARDELGLHVMLYEISELNLKNNKILKTDAPVFSGTTLNVSVGGLCLASNLRLYAKSEPYFLVEFTLNQKDTFLLPAKLMRKGNCPQTAVYKYDYGFQFLYEYVPQEEEKLTTALFTAKLHLINRL